MVPIRAAARALALRLVPVLLAVLACPAAGELPYHFSPVPQGIYAAGELINLTFSPPIAAPGLTLQVRFTTDSSGLDIDNSAGVSMTLPANATSLALKAQGNGIAGKAAPTGYPFRLQATLAATGESFESGPFGIVGKKGIGVYSPNATTVLAAGSVLTVAFARGADNYAANDNVANIVLGRGEASWASSSNFRPLARVEVGGMQNAYTWRLPLELANGSDYRIFVVLAPDTDPCVRVVGTCNNLETGEDERDFSQAFVVEQAPALCFDNTGPRPGGTCSRNPAVNKLVPFTAHRNMKLNVDFDERLPSGSIRMTSGVTLGDCAIECQNTPGCLGFTYPHQYNSYVSNSECFLLMAPVLQAGQPLLTASSNYNHFELRNCSSSNPSCRVCGADADKPGSCLRCFPPKKVEDGFCVDECRSGSVVNGGFLCTPCNTGTYVTSNACVSCDPGTTDHDSDPGTLCQDCPPGTHTDAGHAGNCTKCALGFTDEDSDPSSACTACSRGVSFQNVSGQAGPCRPVTVCGPGEYIAVPATLSSDVVCAACALGTFAAPGLPVPVGACPPCAAGTFTPARGATACEACAPGTADLDENPATSCAPCFTAASNFSAFQNASGQTRCKALSPPCLDIQEEVLAPTPTSDRVCFGCPAGQARSSAEAPFGCRQCPAGTEVLPSNTTACSPCQPGFHDADGSAATRCMRCAEGSFGAGGNSTCQLCAAGYTDDDRDPATPCVHCWRLGQYAPEGTAGNCPLCPAGTMDDDLDSSTPCVSCEPGVSYQDFSGQDFCSEVFPAACPAGMEETQAPTVINNRGCLLCVSGKADLDEDPLTLCQSCAAGSYSGQGATTCAVCVAGKVDDDADPATPCTSCDGVAEFQDEPGKVTCKAVQACADGEVQLAASTTTNNTVCAACPGGTADLDKDPLTPCAGCPAGTAAGPGQSVCQPCLPQGGFQPAANQTNCWALTACNASEYESLAATPTSDRACRPLTNCGGLPVLVNATASSDRVCGSLAPPASASSSGSGAAVFAGAAVAGLLVLVLVGLLIVKRHQSKSASIEPAGGGRNAASLNNTATTSMYANPIFARGGGGAGVSAQHREAADQQAWGGSEAGSGKAAEDEDSVLYQDVDGAARYAAPHLYMEGDHDEGDEEDEDGEDGGEYAYAETGANVGSRRGPAAKSAASGGYEYAAADDMGRPTENNYAAVGTRSKPGEIVYQSSPKSRTTAAYAEAAAATTRPVYSVPAKKADKGGAAVGGIYAGTGLDGGINGVYEIPEAAYVEPIGTLTGATTTGTNMAQPRAGVGAAAELAYETPELAYAEPVGSGGTHDGGEAAAAPYAYAELPAAAAPGSAYYGSGPYAMPADEPDARAESAAEGGEHSHDTGGFEGFVGLDTYGSEAVTDGDGDGAHYATPEGVVGDGESETFYAPLD